MKRLVCLLAALLALSALAKGREVRIRILGTSDIHGNYFPYDFIERRDWGGGLSRVAAYVAEQRRSLGADAVVVLDNGDILQGQPAAYYCNFIDTTSVHACAAALNLIGYDAATVGNHDIETGHAVYDRWTRECRFPVLAANVEDRQTGAPYWQPYAVIERSGIRIAVLGMVTPSVPDWLPETLWSGLAFADMAETARKWMPVLREKERADVVVGLFHSGTGRADATGRLLENATLQTVREVPGFDLVICGHDHRAVRLMTASRAGDSVAVVNPGANGNLVAEADVTLRLDGSRVTGKSVEARLVDIADIAPDTAYCRALDADFRAVERFTAEIIGHNAAALDTRPAFFGPSAFVDFIHQMQLDISGADVSFAAPLSFDAAIPAGDIRVSDLFKLYKYENFLYVMQLTGQEIKDYLERSYDGWTVQMRRPGDHLLRFADDAEEKAEPWQRLATPSYNFDSAAGLLYTVNAEQPAGKKITVTSMADGSPFDPTKTYRVAVNSYRGNGGGELLTAGAGIPKDSLRQRVAWSTEKDLRYYLLQAIRQAGHIQPRPLNQWKFIPEELTQPAARRDAELLFR